jgi:hypothetical protein
MMANNYSCTISHKLYYILPGWLMQIYSPVTLVHVMGQVMTIGDSTGMSRVKKSAIITAYS